MKGTAAEEVDPWQGGVGAPVSNLIWDDIRALRGASCKWLPQPGRCVARHANGCRSRRQVASVVRC